MVFQSPLCPGFASGEFYEETGAAFYLSPDKLGSDHSPVRYERELRLFARHVPGGRVLDVGCGTGGFLHQLTRRFPDRYTVTGTDVAGPALDHAESLGIRVHRGSFLDGTLAGEAFEAVTFWAVLEHLAQPTLFLREARRVLRPGGLCFALVPNLDSLAVRVLGMRYRYILPQHLNYFTAATLARTFAEAGGWQVAAVRYTHFNPLVVVQDFRNRQPFVNDAARAELLARTTALKQRPHLAPLRWGYRGLERLLASLHLTDNVVVIARRG